MLDLLKLCRPSPYSHESHSQGQNTAISILEGGYDDNVNSDSDEKRKQNRRTASSGNSVMRPIEVETALIGIQTEEEALLDALLLRLFTDMGVIKLGLGFNQDLRRLSWSYPWMQSFRACSPILDIQNLVKTVIIYITTS